MIAANYSEVNLNNEMITHSQREVHFPYILIFFIFTIDSAAAEFHAVKTQHQNFSESTAAIKPLTEEEKKAKLAELKERLAKKREEKVHILFIETPPSF